MKAGVSGKYICFCGLYIVQNFMYTATLTFFHIYKIADRVMKLKKQTIMTVNIWTTVFILIVLCIQLPLYFLAAQKFRENAALWTGIIFKIWVAVLASVICANLIVLILMYRLLQTRRRTKVASGYPESDVKMNNLIWRIIKAASSFVIFAAVLIGLMAFDVPLFERTNFSSPACYVDPYSLALRLGVFFWLLLFTTALWFIAPMLFGKIQTFGEGAGTIKAGLSQRRFPPPPVMVETFYKESELN
jgi:magnesium-transporting ATPase (P-type)